VLIKVIDDQNFSLGPITNETITLDFTINSHTNKVVFNVISFSRNIVIIGLFWLALYNPRMDWHTKSLHFETPQHKALKCETFVKSMHGKNQDGVCHVTENNLGDECMQNLKIEGRLEVLQ